jgi:hypothetical protein
MTQRKQIIRQCLVHGTVPHIQLRDSQMNGTASVYRCTLCNPTAKEMSRPLEDGRQDGWGNGRGRK